jgi:hypothetical protein
MMHGYTTEIISPQIGFNDVNSASKYRSYIQYGVSQGWINTKNTRFRPNDTITIGEANKLISAFLGKAEAESPAI